MTLETNYRSTPEVLALANRVLAAGRTRGRRATAGRGGPAAQASRREPGVGAGAGDRRVRDRRGRAGRHHRRDPGARPVGHRARRDGHPRPDQRAAAGDRGCARRGRHPVPRPRRAVLRATRGPARDPGRDRARTRRRQRTARRRGWRPRSSASWVSGATRSRTGRRRASVTGRSSPCSSWPRSSSGRTPTADVAAFLAEVERRTAIEAGGEAAGVELLTYHRAKGLEWDAVFLPALEEGTLPIRQATEPAELAEERRLLYVGITRARRYLWLSWATRRTGATGREGRRSRSRFLDGLVPAAGAAAGRRDRCADGRVRPAGDGRAPKVDPADRSPLSNALRAWRTARARADAVAPFIVFHDSTIEAIAARRPRSMAELRRVPGRRPDEARPLRRGDHRRRRPRAGREAPESATHLVRVRTSPCEPPRT